jgi:hypothetical protein
MATLLRDLIDIPERTSATDYVLRLSESVDEHAAAALEHYVVTEQLAAAFDTALGIVEQALATGESKGAYLEGSFGSGKSHFMAVLHAILRGDRAARDKEGLREVVVRHDADLTGRRLLPLAFHMLSATSFEERVFGSYVEQIRRLHPEAELPRVHQTDGLLRDADALRERLGDEAFFAGLGDTGPSGEASEGWGDFGSSSGWTAATYDAARHAPATDETRGTLVTALVDAYFSSFTKAADYVDMDEGLAEIARHAKSLGYEGVVLFLDELILWLAFGMSVPEFFRREVQKLTKLVESGSGRREIPLISFVAKQIDLRRWLADAGGSGAQQAMLEESLAFQKGRFPSIELGDANLPYVAHQRLLLPKDAAAAAQIADAFARIDRTPGVWRVLLDNVNTDEDNRGSDERDFKLTYPFSPALISTLRVLASAMQRERTALKVMQQMLVDRRDSLTVDDIIPVGDSYDLLVKGDALEPGVNALFASARELWGGKLQPLLRSTHGTTDAAIDAGQAPAPYYADARLAKTLLLSAIAPKVAALRGLTAERLAHLNHGSIVSPIPGGEARAVLGKVRTWAESIPEIHVDSAVADPTISVKLTDVDYESVVKKALVEDTEGRRRQLVQRLVAQELGVDETDHALDGSHPRAVLWRGTQREIDVIFGNVRDVSWLSDQAFEARPGTWRFVIDHPFDEAGHTTAEDMKRIDAMLTKEIDQRTVVWLPHFLSQARMDDLGRLVVLDWLLGGTGERWQQYASHLSEQDRLTALTILRSNRDTLTRSLRDALQQAYGAAPAQPGNLLEDAGHDSELTPLTRRVNVQRPVGAGLGDAFDRLIAQVWDATYPDHPRFPADTPVQRRDLTLIQRHVERAMNDADRRVPIEGDARALRRVGNTLGVGQTTDTHFVFGDPYLTPWATELDKALARRGDHDAPVRVAEARAWVADVGRGLTEPVSDLVILAWAALRQRVWYDAGGQPRATAPEPGQLQAGMEMRTQEMPTEDEWRRAVEHAGHLFGESVTPFLSPAAVADLAERVRARVAQTIEPARELVGQVRRGLGRAGLAPEAIDGSARLGTAVAVAEALDGLTRKDGVALVRALASVEVKPSQGRHMGKSLTSAPAVIDALRRFDWTWLADPLAARAGEGDRADAAGRLLTRLGERLSADELDHPAAAALADVDRDVRDWLRQAPAAPPAPAPLPPREDPQAVVLPAASPAAPSSASTWVAHPGGAAAAPATAPRRSGQTVARGRDALSELEAYVAAHPSARIEVTWRVVE